MKRAVLCAEGLLVLSLAACGGSQNEGAPAQVQLASFSATRMLAQTQSVDQNSVALFSGKFANYTITKTANGFQVVDNAGTGGTTVTSANKLQFSDYSVSLDASGTPAKVYRLYQAAFDRAPDLPGLGFHVSMIDGAGVDVTTVAQGFIDSAEFQQKYGNTDNKSFVNLLYTNILHRAPDPAGLSYWTDVLNNGGTSRALVLSGFSESNENVVAVNDRTQNGIAYAPYNTSGAGSALELGGGKIAWGNNGSAAIVLRDPRGIEIPAGHVTCASTDEQKLSISSDCHTVSGRALGSYSVNVSGDGVTASLALKVIPPRRLFATGPEPDSANGIVTSDGKLLVWGRNNYGVLGQGVGSQTLGSSSLPLFVKNEAGTAPLANIVSAAVGEDHAIALTEDGTALIWGDMYDVGFGYQSSSLPKAVLDSTGSGRLSKIVQVGIGDSNAAALTETGNVYSWGYYHGQGVAGLKSFPNYVLDPNGKDPLSNIVSISVGWNFTLALGSNGKVYAWGWNDRGQTGRGSTDNPEVMPATVQLATTDHAELTNVVAISAGYNFALALTADGTVYAWGSNDYGQIGQNSTQYGYWVRAVPVKDSSGLDVLRNIVMVSAGGRHALALDATGHVYSWGHAVDGELGDGANRPAQNQSLKPIPVVGPGSTLTLGGIVSIQAGNNHSLAASRDGTLYAFGDGFGGTLGQGGTSTSDVAYPVPVKNLAGTGNLSLAPLTGYAGLISLRQ
jgi:alpha-tubulin suppressor-like RCC1 family protein